MTTKTIERWMAAYATAERKPSNRTIRKYLVVLHGIFKLAVRTHGLPLNPVTTIEKPRTRQRAGIEVLTPTEVRAFVRAAESEQDAAIFLTAAFAGLRLGELLGLRWRDVDFAGESIHVRSNFTRGEETTPKSGKGRVVPMAPEVAQALAKLGQRDHSTGDRDLVFVNDIGGHVDDHRMRRRFKTALKRAELRADFRFHDLRHMFGSTMIRRVDPRVLQGYMGHASITTTEMYLAFRPRTSDAQAISDAFAEETIEA
jgi:integrase